MRPSLKASCLTLLLLGSLLACTEKPATSLSTETETRETSAAASLALEDASLHAWQLGTASLQDTAYSLQALQKTIVVLLLERSEESLALARKQWHESHERYHNSAIFLAIGESNPGLFGHLQTLTFNLDAWPIQPGYIDSYGVYTHSGIVNDITVPLNAEAIRRQHGFSDDSEVTLGFHAIAYLLWGENGERRASDFSEAKSNINLDTAPADLPANRRRVLLQLQAQLLVDDAHVLLKHWQFPKGQLKSQYEALEAGSRIELLQAAAAHLLQNLIQPLFEQTQGIEGAAATDSETAHNRFAGNTRAMAAAAVDGLDRLFADPKLGSVIILEGERVQWQTLLGELQDKLKAEPSEQEDFSPLLNQLVTLLEPALLRDVNPT